MSKPILRLAGAVLSLGLAVSASSAAGAITTTPACSIKTQLANKALAKLYAYAYDPNSQKVLLSVNGEQPTPSASVLKVLTGASAVMFLPSDYTATTRVMQSAADPTVLYLVGGGDHTLSSMTGNSYTTYHAPAHLNSLVYRLLKAVGKNQTISKIVVDESFFDENDFNSHWKASDRTNGYVAPISSLMLDGDRVNGDLTSTKYDATRYVLPAIHAGQVFRTMLGAAAAQAKVEAGLTPSDAVELASVTSQPMSVWIDHALKISDNTETEMIARHVEKALGLPTTFASAQPMVQQMLDALDIPSKGLTMFDASGLSQQDRVTPKIIVRVLAEAATDNPRLPGLLDYLATPDSFGTLTTRFKHVGVDLTQSLRAKTGFIPGLSSMAGVVVAKDGTTIVFAFFARNVPSERKFVSYDTRGAIDSLVARLWECGAKLTTK